ncbi:MAG: hypothetical protein JSS79_15425 [Bacteroidetes bacterium]|nr:hypothetical protein [Bacteroidota bacterium]
MSTLSLLLFGSLNIAMGLAWNARRRKLTQQFSPKYRAIWVIGIVEIAVATAMMLK